MNNKFEINSTKRMSDGAILTIGQVVLVVGDDGEYDTDIITNIFLCDTETIGVETKDSNHLHMIDSIKLEKINTIGF